MDPNSKEFKALQAKWYGKLKADGFEDIEQDEDTLKLWSSHFFKARYNATLFEAKEEYYRLAGQFLHEHPFQEKLEQLIWSLHCEGKSIRDIVATLKKKRFNVYKSRVHGIIQRLAQTMVTEWQSKK